MSTEKIHNNEIFEEMPVAKAVRTMAVPTVISQLIVLIYNMADTFFIGRTDNPYMVAGASLILPVFNITLSLSGLAGVGGGALISRLLGRKQVGEAQKVYSFCVYLGACLAALFSVGVLVFMRPLMQMLGAGADTYRYASSYAFFVIVCGAVPTVLSNVLSTLLRSVGESRKAGFGITMGGLINIVLDPLFMFVLLPDGMEITGAGAATCLSNYIACTYFAVILFRMNRGVRVQSASEPRGSGRKAAGRADAGSGRKAAGRADAGSGRKAAGRADAGSSRKAAGTGGEGSPVLRLCSPRCLPSRESLAGIFIVGIPSSVATLLFDLDYVIIDRLMSGYSDVALAAVGIVLKAERLPLNVGIGICQGMMPIIAYNYSAKNYRRMNDTKRYSLRLGLTCALISITLYELFAGQIMRIFISDAETVALGIGFLRARVLATPLMFLSFFHVYLFNGFGKGEYALFLGVMRWLAFNIPMLFLLNWLIGMNGLVWSQAAADILTVLLSLYVYRRYERKNALTAQTQ